MSHAADQASIRAYVEDFECLISGAAYMAELESKVLESRSTAAITQHYELHPEDKLCHIYRPGTNEMVLCRRSGVDAIWKTARRLASEAPNSNDLSVKRIAEIIGERVIQVAIDGITDDEEYVEILKSYVTESEKEHVEACHHIPCVLFFNRGRIGPNFPSPPPKCFALGPVTFQTFDSFRETIESAIKDGSKDIEEQAIDRFSETAEKHGWVATVNIPRCAPDVSRTRAEEVIEGAINILKVLIGLDYGMSMRLPHTAPAKNTETCVLTEIDGSIRWTWHGRSLDGALVAGDLISQIPTWVRDSASALLTRALKGNRSEMTNRLLDALQWFGDASFEESSGVRIVKWVAALERITSTERVRFGLTLRFCSRAALLATGLGAGDVETAFRDAWKAYSLRSDVMHGSRSQDEHHLDQNVRFVHDFTRTALLGGLALQDALDRLGSSQDASGISRLYGQVATPFETLFKKLHRELGVQNRAQREDSPGKIGRSAKP